MLKTELSKEEKSLTIFLGTLMQRYQERVPDVKKITTAMIKEEIIGATSDIENDHIAFRTMGVSNLGIQSLEKIFLHCGYKTMEHYYFKEKKLDAFWYSPPKPNYPRIFISELRVRDLSEKAKKIITSYTAQVKTDPVLGLDLDNGLAVGEFLHRPLWQTPTWADYNSLQQESEYAAWVIYNRYYLNHYTISVHNLPDGYNDIAKFNIFLEANGIKLNNSGGKIKVSGDKKLLQSSTVSGMIDAEFPDGQGKTIVKQISGSYIEFAERKVLDQFVNIPKDQIKREHRRDGFETSNADKIFESTYSSQTARK